MKILFLDKIILDYFLIIDGINKNKYVLHPFSKYTTNLKSLNAGFAEYEFQLMNQKPIRLAFFIEEELAQGDNFLIQAQKSLG